MTSETGRKRHSQEAGMNLESAPLQPVSGLMTGKKQIGGFRSVGEGPETGSQRWSCSIVIEETEKNPLMSNVFQKQLESHSNDRCHESKVKGRPIWSTGKRVSICMVRKWKDPLMNLLRHPYLVPTSSQPIPIHFPGDNGRATLAELSSHYLLRQRCGVCISWCVGYFHIAVKDLLWLLFNNRVSYNNSGERHNRVYVGKSLY